MAIETYKLANGETRYKAVAYLESNQKTTKRGFKTKKAAKKWIAEQQVLGKEKPKSLLTYGEVVEMWLEASKPTVKASTYCTMTTDIKASFKYIDPSTLISAITTEDISRLAQAYAVQYCQSKIKLSRVENVFKYAVLEDIIEDNPFRKLRKPKQKKKGKDYQLWSTENLSDFLDACKKDKKTMVYPMFRLLAYTGIRAGELLALKWSDLDGNILHIRRTLTRDYDFNFIVGDDGKTASAARDISIDDETLRILREWQRICPSTKKMFLCTHTTMERWMNQIIDQNPNIPPSTPHKLRHLHCTILLDAKENIKDVQERMGHSTPQTTLNVYAHANKNKTHATDFFTSALERTTL